MPIQMISPELNFQQILNQNKASLDTLVKGDFTTLQNTQPLAIYDIQNDGIFYPKLTGWRYFIVSNGKLVSSADIAVNANDNSHRFLYFTKGYIVENILDKISEIESSEIIKNSIFEIRILRVNIINLLAIWLHGTDEDLVYAIDSNPLQEKPYSLQWVTEKVKEELKRIDSGNALTPHS